MIHDTLHSLYENFLVSIKSILQLVHTNVAIDFLFQEVSYFFIAFCIGVFNLQTLIFKYCAMHKDVFDCWLLMPAKESTGSWEKKSFC